jgi:hypothetical protein
MIFDVLKCSVEVPLHGFGFFYLLRGVVVKPGMAGAPVIWVGMIFTNYMNTRFTSR